MNSLSRFHNAQASSSTGYDTALAEIRRGRKTSHWIWYIFPQIAGLGRSSPARASVFYFLIFTSYFLPALFRAAAQSLAVEDPAFDALAQRCVSILDQTSAQGYPACAQTLAQPTG